MTRIVAAALIIVGSFLEIWYYTIRFQQDGTDGWLSVVIGVALTMFLAVLTMLRKANRWAIPAALALAAYSVFCTAAGQSFALSLVLEDRAEDAAGQANARDAIGEYQQNIARLDREMEQLLAATEGLTLRERANYRTFGIAPIEERKTAIKQERTEWQNRIDAERGKLTTHDTVAVQDVNVYTFYAGLFGWKPSNVQVFLQVILSVFIALMAPTGIIMAQSSASPRVQPDIPEPVDKPAPDPTPPGYAQQTKAWAHITWYGIRAGKTNRLMNIQDVKRAAESRGIENDLFGLILDNAQRNGIINLDANGIMTPAVSEQEAVAILTGGNNER